MKKTIIFLFFLFLAAALAVLIFVLLPEYQKRLEKIRVSRDKNVTFYKVITNTRDDEGYSILQAGDGGLVVLGLTTSIGAGNEDMYLVKTDVEGKVEWERAFGGIEGERGWSVTKAHGGGYVILGSTNSIGAGKNDMYLVKTDADGNKEWEKTYGGVEHDEGRSVCSTSDGGYALTGFTRSYGAGNTDFFLVKVDKDGNLQWQKTYGGPDQDKPFCVKQARDGGYIIAGYSNSLGAGASDMYLVKTDKDGVFQWGNAFGGSGFDDGHYAVQTDDGGYLLLGKTDSFGAGRNDFYLVKTDKDGNMLWQKTYGGKGEERGWSIDETADGGYVMTGDTSSYTATEKLIPFLSESEKDTPERNFYLVKIDTDGNVIWERAYGTEGEEVGWSVCKTFGGGFAMTGIAEPKETRRRSVCIIKVDSEGNF